MTRSGSSREKYAAASSDLSPAGDEREGHSMCFRGLLRYRLVKPQDPTAYLSCDISRIESAYLLMSELRLIDTRDGLRLTQTGQKVLNKVRLCHACQ